MGKRILEVLTLLLILAFPLGEVARVDVGGGVFLIANDIFVGLVVAWFYGYKLFARSRLKGQHVKPIFLFIAVAGLSLLLNPLSLKNNELFVSFLYLVRFVCYASLYFVVLEFDKLFLQKMIKLMIFSGVLVLVGGYIQYFSYPNLRNLHYLGWDEHLYRMFSSFLDPNFLGSFLVLFFFLQMGIMINLLREKQKNEKYAKPNSIATHRDRDKIQYTFLRFPVNILIVLQIFTLIALFLTFSRSAFIMFLVTVLLLLILMNMKKLILVVVGVFVVLTLLFSTFLKSEGTNLLRTTSTGARFIAAENTLSIIEKYPLTGVGFNAYRYAQEKYGLLEKQSKANHAAAGTDNSYLFVLATTGIVGFGAFVFLLGSIVKNSWKGYNQGKNLSVKTKNLIFLCCFIGLLVNTLFINSFFYIFIVEGMFVGLGVIENS